MFPRNKDQKILEILLKFKILQPIFFSFIVFFIRMTVIIVNLYKLLVTQAYMDYMSGRKTVYKP